ncbi:MAG: hypothetical protein QXK66_04840 [Sulfolobales archaeon]
MLSGVKPSYTLPTSTAPKVEAFNCVGLSMLDTQPTCSFDIVSDFV